MEKCTGENCPMQIGYDVEKCAAIEKCPYRTWPVTVADRSSYTRLRELVEAEKEGRLVVLPCKVGQRVFALLDTDKHISECEVKQIGMGNKIGFIGLEPIGARGRRYGVALNGFGKTVFLTREEAEKALEAMKDE